MLNYKKAFLLMCLGLMVLAVNGQTRDSVRTISLSVKPGLQFDLVRFQVHPGERIKIVFTNTDDMDHNLVITKPGAREQVVREALSLGQSGPEMNYIPRSPAVLWSMPVLSPKQVRSITFTVPKETGAYPYVCTYPGHGFVMFGAMYVTDGAMPDRASDLNIPAIRREETDANTAKADAHAGHRAESKPLHPYKPVPPYLYRVFIDGASPAAIAVSLTENLSYCWDAGTSSLRFAWSGGFLDNTQLWQGKGDATAKVVGQIFFRDKSTFPIRVASPAKIPKADYKGYAEINEYPEFHYTVDGIDVYELILPKPDGSGLIRTFRIPAAVKPVWFVTSPVDGVSYQATSGKWENNQLLLSPAQAKKFSITMTRKEGAGL